MNKRPIEQARDKDLRLSAIALQRAVQRAHDVAYSTGTTVVVSQNGIVEHRIPQPTVDRTSK